jgi:hypothetical protein
VSYLPFTRKLLKSTLLNNTKMENVNTSKTSNLVKLLVVACLMIACTAVFTFFYGKKYQAGTDQVYRDSLTAVNKSLLDTVHKRDTVILVINSKYLKALADLSNKKVEYVSINKKYDKIDSVVRDMPVDDQVKFLANWVSQADTLQR